MKGEVYMFTISQGATSVAATSYAELNGLIAAAQRALASWPKPQEPPA